MSQRWFSKLISKIFPRNNGDLNTPNLSTEQKEAQAKYVKEKMVQERHLEIKAKKTQKELDDLERKMFMIQQSTKTSIPQFLKLHNKLRMKFDWYYRWTATSYANPVHYGVLVLFIVFSALIAFSGKPQEVAAASPCTSVGSGNWSNPVTWGSSCPIGSGIPLAGDNVVIAAGHTVTVDSAQNIGDGTVTVDNTGSITFNASLISGAIDASAATAITLGADVTLNTSASSGAVNFGSRAVTNLVSFSFTINAGSGAVTLGAIGGSGVNSFKSLTITSGLTTLNGSIYTNTAAGVNLSGASGGVTLGADITITPSSNGAVNFGTNAINATTDNLQGLTINCAASTITLGPVGTTKIVKLLKLFSTGSATYNLSGDVIAGTSGVDSDGTGSYLVISADVTIDTTYGNGPVNFHAAGTAVGVKSLVANTSSLTIKSGTGAITTGSGIGTALNSSLKAFTVETTTGLTTVTSDITTGGVGGVNFSNANGGAQITNGTRTITTTNGGGNGPINFGSNVINGASANSYNLVINAGSGAVTLGAVGTTNMLSSLTVTSGPTTLKGNIIAGGASGVNLSGVVSGIALGADVTINTSANSRLINFGANSVVNSDTANARSLALTSGNGAITLGTLGSTAALKSLAVTTTASGVTTLNGNITTGTATGVSFSTAQGGVVLGADVTINTVGGSGDGVINFGTRALTNASGKTLTITAGTGVASLGPVAATGSSLTGLTITSGVVDIASYSMNIGTLSNNGTLKLSGDTGTITVGTFDSDSGTVEYSAAAGTRDIKNKTYYNLNVNGAGTFTLPGDIAVNGNLDATTGTLSVAANNLSVVGNINIAAGGTLTATTSTISCGGNWSRLGTFNKGNSTVVLNGMGDSTVSYNTEFNNLTINTDNSTAGRTVSFVTGSIQTIIGTLNLSGASSDKYLTLARSGGSSTDIYEFAIPSDMTSGQFINVSNNRVTGGEISPGNYSNVKDGGNNTGWRFDIVNPTLTITNLIDNKLINQKTFTFEGTALDVLAGIDSVSIQIDGGLWQAATSVDGFATWNYAWADYADGKHTVSIKAIDNAGNTTSSNVYTIIVDTVAPGVPTVYVFDVSDRLVGTYQTLINWQPVTDETSGVKNYEVYRGADKIATTSDNYYVDEKLPVSSYQYHVVAIDNATNSATSDDVAVNLTLNSTELNLSGVKATPSNLVDMNGKTTATISWKTDQPATSLVKFGLGEAKSETSKLSTKLNMGHEVVLTGLEANTTYHYQVFSKDMYGQEVTSSDLTFTTDPGVNKESIWNSIIKTIKKSFQWIAHVTAVSLEKLNLIHAPEQVNANLIVFDVSVSSANIYQSFVVATSQSISKSNDGLNFNAVQTNRKSWYFDQNLSSKQTYYYKSANLDGMVSVRPGSADTTAPVISNILAKEIGQTKDRTEVVISWQTDKLSSSEVSIDNQTLADDSLNQEHTMTISNLKPGQTYRYKVTSISESEIGAISGEQTLTTTPAPEDRTIWETIIKTLQNVFNSVKSWAKAN